QKIMAAGDGRVAAARDAARTQQSDATDEQERRCLWAEARWECAEQRAEAAAEMAEAAERSASEARRQAATAMRELEEEGDKQEGEAMKRVLAAEQALSNSMQWSAEHDRVGRSLFGVGGDGVWGIVPAGGFSPEAPQALAWSPRAAIERQALPRRACEAVAWQGHGRPLVISQTATPQGPPPRRLPQAAPPGLPSPPRCGVEAPQLIRRPGQRSVRELRADIEEALGSQGSLSRRPVASAVQSFVPPPRVPQQGFFWNSQAGNSSSTNLVASSSASLVITSSSNTSNSYTNIKNSNSSNNHIYISNNNKIQNNDTNSNQRIFTATTTNYSGNHAASAGLSGGSTTSTTATINSNNNNNSTSNNSNNNNNNNNNNNSNYNSNNSSTQLQHIKASIPTPAPFNSTYHNCISNNSSNNYHEQLQQHRPQSATIGNNSTHSHKETVTTLGSNNNRHHKQAVVTLGSHSNPTNKQAVSLGSNSKTEHLAAKTELGNSKQALTTTLGSNTEHKQQQLPLNNIYNINNSNNNHNNNKQPQQLPLKAVGSGCLSPQAMTDGELFAKFISADSVGLTQEVFKALMHRFLAPGRSSAAWEPPFLTVKQQCTQLPWRAGSIWNMLENRSKQPEYAAAPLAKSRIVVCGAGPC
ncbi:unnamed protein product, partial [Polarella glacialis]